MRAFAKVFLCVVLLAGSAAAYVNGDLYEIPKTTVAPVIDGLIDNVWKAVDNNYQTSYGNSGTEPDGWFDMFGWSRMMWDDENMYGLYYYQDDIIVDEHANPWEKDGFEIYFDADDSKGGTAANGTDYDGVNDMQLRINHHYTTADQIDVGNPVGGWTWVRDGVEFVCLDDASGLGWYLEFKMPLADLFIDPMAESLIGFEIQQNDNDSAQRDHISKWWVQEGDPSWNNAASWGTAILSGETVGEGANIWKTPVAPTIDGDMEAAWANGRPIVFNNFDNAGAGSEPEDYLDFMGTAVLMHDGTNLYAFLETWDDILVDEHANSYERDCWELYFDADNSKGATDPDGWRFDQVNDVQLRFGHAYTEPANIEAGWGDPWTAWPSGEFWANGGWDRAGVDFTVKDTDMGYNIEIVMPMECLYLAENTEIGLDVTAGDNDSDHRETIAKWWLMDGDESWKNAATFGNAFIKDRVFGGAVEDKGVVANSFALAQNYPNPFNPVTTISYGLKAAGSVRLSVFDMMGKEVAVLVDGSQSAGQHQVAFNAANLSSGIYFYKLQTAAETFTRKMTLVK